MTGNEGARLIWWVACAGALALGLMPTPTAAGDVVNAKMADLEATMELVMRQSGGLARGDAGGDAGRAGEADASNLIPALDTLDSKPYMTDDEVAFLWRYLTAGAIDHYFEFGCGGSSLLAAAVPSIGNITCVDSDRKWIAKVVESSGGRVNGVFVDIGKLKYWGYPLDKQKKADWWKYPTAILGSTPDLVLIDGRFRVACAMYTLVATDPETRVIVHDYINRPQYHVVEEFYRVDETTSSIVAMRPKPDVDFRAWQAVLEDHKFDLE